jgi:hypothetical protein
VQSIAAPPRLKEICAVLRTRRRADDLSVWTCFSMGGQSAIMIC